MVEITFKFDAFSFKGICQTVPLTLCPVIGKDEGIVPVCYSRNVELADNLIFQPGKPVAFSILSFLAYVFLFCSATLILDVVAIVMVGFMTYHVRSKYTAVGNVSAADGSAAKKTHRCGR